MSRAVLFDVDGVLVHGYHARPEKQVRWDERLLQDMGIDPGRFSAEFIHESFIKKVLIGDMSLVAALDRVLPQLGYSGTTMTFISYWMSNDSVVNAPLLDLIGSLKATGDAALYVATNQEHHRAFWLWHTLGLGNLFADIFYSARLGALKPNRPFFDAIATRIGRQAEPPLFFDDRDDVVKAARAYGWEAVLFNDLADCAGHPWIAARIEPNAVRDDEGREDAARPK